MIRPILAALFVVVTAGSIAADMSGVRYCVFPDSAPAGVQLSPSMFGKPAHDCPLGNLGR